ncbi:DUF317 domain-containing protein [Streptomyces sp. NPDC056831]|uniref:DUF317 domain-containing protein n=1 Tax=Streptomyces sp. NPDC056831 TaxID=3345954 RepID=UPI003679F6CE
MTGFASNDLVLVSPRHLAGTGTKLDDAIGPLIHLFGWPYEHTPSTGRISIDSPCRSVFLDFAPDRQDGKWWTIAHHEPYWQIEFSRQVPLEAVAAVTQALPQLLGDRRHADRIPLATEAVATIATGSDWTWKATAAGGEWVSPDGHCTVQHTADADVPWTVSHSVYDGFDTHWSASFTRNVPEPLIAQFVSHLSDTTPVERQLSEIPALATSSALITPARSDGVTPRALHAAAQIGRALPETSRIPVSRRSP